MKESQHTVLCIEDNKANLELIKFVLEKEGFDVAACDSLEKCLFKFRAYRFGR